MLLSVTGVVPTATEMAAGGGGGLRRGLSATDFRADDSGVLGGATGFILCCSSSLWRMGMAGDVTLLTGFDSGSSVLGVVGTATSLTA